MKCYNKHSDLIAVIHSDAISNMTWHDDGIYIYWRCSYRMYDEIYSDRAGCIKCDWTTTERVSQEVFNYIVETFNVPIITLDTEIYETPSDEYKIIE